MLWIGLTGGIATGKSTVSRLLRVRGFDVVDADALAREAVEIGTKAHREIVHVFGPSSLLSSGELDRKKMAEIIFADPAKRNLLESIIHPEVRALAMKHRLAIQAQGASMAFYDVPLLFEKNMEALFDHVTVVASRAVQAKQRLMSRDGLSQDEADLRIASQIGIEEKVARAAAVIWNDGSLKDLELNVDTYVRNLPRPDETKSREGLE